MNIYTYISEDCWKPSENRSSNDDGGPRGESVTVFECETSECSFRWVGIP